MIQTRLDLQIGWGQDETMLYPEQVLLFRGYWVWIRNEIRAFGVQKMKDLITV